jgi:hypothetical protein
VKIYRLEQRTKQWQTVASAANLDELIAAWQSTATKNGKRIIRNDGKLIRQELPETY